MVYLCQSDVVMVDVTVFEEAPQLQAGQQEDVIWGGGISKPAVETIDRPQLWILPQYCKIHLLHISHSIRAETGLKIRMWAKGHMLTILQCEVRPDLFTLSLTISIRDFIQKMFNVQSHVWCWDRGFPTWQRKCTCNKTQNSTPLYLMISECNTVTYHLDMKPIYCRCLPHRGVGALRPLRLFVIIWSSTNCPSKTCPSLKVNFPCEPYSHSSLHMCVLQVGYWIWVKKVLKGVSKVPHRKIQREKHYKLFKHLLHPSKESSIFFPLEIWGQLCEAILHNLLTSPCFLLFLHSPS